MSRDADVRAVRSGAHELTGDTADFDPLAALGDFTRFPRWTWRNAEVVTFLHWLCAHNAAAATTVGFYGLDHASLHGRATLPVGPAGWNARERHMAETLHALRMRLGDDDAPAKVVVWAHNSHDARRAALQPTRLQRAIGAIYRPDTERVRHYVFVSAARAIHALIHLDVTTALEPLDPDLGRQPADILRTSPTGV